MTTEQLIEFFENEKNSSQKLLDKVKKNFEER